MDPPPGDHVDPVGDLGQNSEVPRIELTITVDEGHPVAGRGSEAVGHGDPIAGLASVGDDSQVFGLVPHLLLSHRHRLVGAAVVDQDDLEGIRELAEGLPGDRDHPGHVRRLVVHRDDKGDLPREMDAPAADRLSHGPR